MTHRAVQTGPKRRTLVAKLLIGTTAMGTGIALLLHARLGLMPLDVLHAAISNRTGWTLGQAFVATQAMFLAAYIPLRIRWGIGTFVAATIPAIVCDLITSVLPPVDNVLVRVALLAIGATAFATGVATYLAADLGALPRDGVMVDLARRLRTSLAPVRVAFDLTSLIIGVVLLGPAHAINLGIVGPASVLLALLLGPTIARLLRHLTSTRTRS